MFLRFKAIKYNLLRKLTEYMYHVGYRYIEAHHDNTEYCQKMLKQQAETLPEGDPCREGMLAALHHRQRVVFDHK